MPAISNSSTSASTLSRVRSTIVTRGEPGVTVSPGSTWREMTTPSIGASDSVLGRLGLEPVDCRLGGVAAGDGGRLLVRPTVRRGGGLAAGEGKIRSSWKRARRSRRPDLGLDQPRMGLPQRGLHLVGPKLDEQVALADGRILPGRHVDDRPEDLGADGDLGTGIGDDSPLGGDPAG